MNVNVLEDAGPRSIKVAMAKHRTCGQAPPCSAEKALKERPVAHLQEQSVNVEAWREVINYDAEEYEEKLCRSYRKGQQRKDRENANGLMRYGYSA